MYNDVYLLHNIYMCSSVYLLIDGDDIRLTKFWRFAYRNKCDFTNMVVCTYIYIYMYSDVYLLIDSNGIPLGKFWRYTYRYSCNFACMGACTYIYIDMYGGVYLLIDSHGIRLAVIFLIKVAIHRI